MWVKTQDAYTQQYCCFQPIKVNFYNYPLISIHDRMPRILLLSLTCLNMPTDKIVTQTNFTVQFTLGSLSLLGRDPWMPHLASPPGCREIPQRHCLPPSLYQERRQQEIECMVSLQCGWAPIRPGFPLWRKQLGELTALASSGPDWPYTLVWLNKDTHHAPVPKEGHLGSLPEGGTNRTACRRMSQVEVHQLLWLDSQVVYPVGLNGHEIPLITTLPRSLANGTSLTGGKSIYLKVDIPQSIVGESDQKVFPLANVPPSWWSAPSRPLHQNQKERSAWPWKWGNSCLGQYWTCLIMCQGTQPQKDQILWLYSHLHPTNWEILLGQWIHHPRWAPQMMLRWQKPPLRKSPLPQPRHQGPTVVPLPTRC